jgi:hypothetical protein
MKLSNSGGAKKWGCKKVGVQKLLGAVPNASGGGGGVCKSFLGGAHRACSAIAQNIIYNYIIYIAKFCSRGKLFF